MKGKLLFQPVENTLSPGQVSIETVGDEVILRIDDYEAHVSALVALDIGTHIIRLATKIITPADFMKWQRGANR
jgi:hypothetical protein